MSQARDPREQDQPGGVGCPQPGQSASQFLEKNLFSVNNPLGSGVTNPLLPSPASLQLAQLQAQLTLQRLKLAQSAVTSNTAAATVLNQVLSKVAMSQPLFNPLRNAAMIGTHGPGGMVSLGPAIHNARFTSAGLRFPPQNPVVQPKNLSQNSLQPFGKAGNKPDGFHVGSQSFASETEQSAYHGFACGSEETSDGHYPFTHNNPSGFKNQYFDDHGPHHNMSHKGDVSQVVHHASNNQWESSHMWQSPSQQYESRNELYNPEEPTSDTKFSPSSSPGFSRQNNGKMTNCGSSMKNTKSTELNDFHGVPPLHLPHTCTMCDKKVFNLKDWDLHIKGRMHLQNVLAYSESTGIKCVSNPTDGMAPSSLNADFHPMNSEGIALEMDQLYAPQAPSASFLPSSVSFPGPPIGAKFAQRKPSVGRVVHICNLPEGSCNENDVVNLGLPFGKVTNYILMKSTNQAFLEMAYTEAAEAMVQFYQEKPAMINDEKLLIRMSKRYKELQLKKPGKTVDAIIYDLHSQRDRDMFRDTDRYRNERTRSRSPVSRSLSPRSHTPSFTSCSSTHSPLGASRTEWGNGRETWEQPAYGGRWEDDRERGIWRDNGDENRDRTDHWVHDRRQHSRQADKQVLDDRIDGSRGHREKYSNPHSSSRYKGKKGEHYRRESKPKSESASPDKAGNTKRKEEGKLPEVSDSQTEAIGKKETAESKHKKEAEGSREQRIDNKTPDTTDITENKISEQTGDKEEVSNHNSLPDKAEKEREKTDTEPAVRQKEQDWESGSELEGDSWYPANMEELVTVDEVGEEDLIVEPDITELEEIVPVVAKDSSNGIQMCAHGINAVDLQCHYKQRTRSECSSVAMSCTSLRESASPDSSCCETVANVPDVAVDPEERCKELEGNGKSPTRLDVTEGARDSMADTLHPEKTAADQYKRTDSPAEGSVVMMEVHIKEERRNNREREISMSDGKSPEVPELEPKEIHSSPSWEPDDVFTDLSIPLGVEFVVPRTGFYCKLCGLFYTSEEAAKTTHCRSRVHYKKLQSYLSRLAEEGPEKSNTESTAAPQEDVGIVPQFDRSRP